MDFVSFHGLAILGDLNVAVLTLPLTLAKKVGKDHFLKSKSFRNISFGEKKIIIIIRR